MHRAMFEVVEQMQDLLREFVLRLLNFKRSRSSLQYRVVSSREEAVARRNI
jgi:hypothetical protein